MPLPTSVRLSLVPEDASAELLASLTSPSGGRKGVFLLPISLSVSLSSPLDVSSTNQGLICPRLGSVPGTQ